MNFIRWFYFYFIQILKSPQVFWNNFGGLKQNTYMIWFGYICLFIGIGLETLNQLALVDLTQLALSRDGHLVDQLSSIFNMSPEKWKLFFPLQLILLKKESLLVLVFLPILPYFAIYLYAGALHFTMQTFGYIQSSESSYDKTLGLFCFSLAPAVFGAIPFIGGWIASIWIFVLLVKGLSETYALSFLRSLIAILMPAFLIKMVWAVAMESMLSAIPNTYFEQSFLSSWF